MLIYCINRVLKRYINIPVIGYLCKCHLNDFIGGIVFCAYFNLILIAFERQTINKYYQIFIIILCTGIIWEYVFPIFLNYSISDIYDVLAYILGATVYYFIKKKGKEIDG